MHHAEGGEKTFIQQMLQMFYLATRCAQQISLRQGELFTDLIVSDYLYAKDRLFAEETLGGAEMALYDRFANLLGESIAVPDFVLFLDAPTDVVLNRIGNRGIQSEQVIEGAYLDSLRDRYYALWDRYDAAPVYVMNTTEVDYTSNPSQRQWMLDILSGWLKGEPHPDAPEAYQSRNKLQLALL